MFKNQRKVYIGTSGWQYRHWQEIFYPNDLPLNKWLPFYAQNFQTVEINSSFYHLPKKKTFEGWRTKTPANFLFAIKVWRRITHLKKLNNIQEDLKIFFRRTQSLKEKFGPLLFQFPANFRMNAEKLDNLGKMLRKVDRARHCAFEFRHPSWFNKKVYQILKKYNLTLCWADTPDYPYYEEDTTDYIYLRLHGHQKLYSSKYTKRQLNSYGHKIQKLINRDKTVYIYFDNDARGHAIENARELKKII